MTHGNTKLEKLIYIDFSRLAYKIIFDLNPKKYKLIIEIDSLNISWNLNQLRNKNNSSVALIF